jgi:glycosyltransferase involved in cell wall biosynthesis
MKVSIVIPCYNEKATIEKIVEPVRSAPIESKEIIVVDNCSQGGTRAVLEEKISRMVDRIIYHQVNRGKGAASRLPPVISFLSRTRILSTPQKIIQRS